MPPEYPATHVCMQDVPSATRSPRTSGKERPSFTLPLIATLTLTLTQLSGKEGDRYRPEPRTRDTCWKESLR